MSGWLWWNWRTPSRPSVASETAKPSRSSMVLRSWRMSASSSMTNTEI